MVAAFALLATGTAGAAGGQFSIAPPPLGHPTFEEGEVQYRLGLGYKAYRDGETDMAGPSVSLQRRQALSDRFAFNLGGVADYVSGTDYIVSEDDDISLWQTMFHLTGEYQMRFTPKWNAILFGGPKLGYGGYEVEQKEAPQERIDASNEILGYVVGLQTSMRLGSLRITPFGSYEELDATHESDSSETGRSTTDYTYEVTQYGLDVLFVGSGLTLSAILQDLSVGPVEENYTVYQVSYQF
jgi:hypothetical protein